MEKPYRQIGKMALSMRSSAKNWGEAPDYLFYRQIQSVPYSEGSSRTSSEVVRPTLPDKIANHYTNS